MEILKSTWLSLAFVGLLAGCSSLSSNQSFIVTATNTGAKFREDEQLAPGDSVQWQGQVDSKGFASGRGTKTFLTNGKPTVAMDADFINGIETACEFEMRKYNSAGDAIVYRHTGRHDALRQPVGRIDTVYVNPTNDSDPVSEYANYANGVKNGERAVFYKNGDRTFYTYSNGKNTDYSKILKDGTEVRNFILDRQMKLIQGEAEFRRRTAEATAARRAENNSFLLNGLAQGLGQVAAETSSYGGRISAPGSNSSQTTGASSYHRTPPITLTQKVAEGYANSETLQDSRGKSHLQRVPYGPNKTYKTAEEAAREANRLLRIDINEKNARYVKEDREKAARERSNGSSPALPPRAARKSKYVPDMSR